MDGIIWTIIIPTTASLRFMTLSHPLNFRVAYCGHRQLAKAAEDKHDTQDEKGYTPGTTSWLCIISKGWRRRTFPYPSALLSAVSRVPSSPTYTPHFRIVHAHERAEQRTAGHLQEYFRRIHGVRKYEQNHKSTTQPGMSPSPHSPQQLKICHGQPPRSR